MPRAALCPFYGGVQGERLDCLLEGDGGKGKPRMRMYFPSKDLRAWYFKKYCCANWKKCTLAVEFWNEFE